MTVQWGFFAGVASGIVMAFFSDVAYRLGLFRSSLIVVDGSYALRMMGRPGGEQSTASLYALGILVHLVTSGVFGAVYPLLTGLFHASPPPFRIALCCVCVASMVGNALVGTAYCRPRHFW